jgi:hypothetical protein
MPRRLTLFSGEPATKASSVPLSVGIGGTNQNPYTKVGHDSTTQLEAPNENHEAFTQRKL